MEEKTITETDRLILRRYREEDLQDLYEYLSDESVVRFEPYKPMDLNEAKEKLGRRILSDEMVAVELRSDRKLIGNVYLGKRTAVRWSRDMSSTGVTGDRDMRKKAARH